MMVRECTSTCYLLFSIVVVPASDPKDLFMECLTKFTAQSTWLIWVGLVE
jgi:ubiquitin C-terminal hydrolase